MKKKEQLKPGVEAPSVTVEDTTKSTKKDSPIVDLAHMSEEQAQNYVAGLDPNRRMDLIRVMHETYRTDPMAAAHTGFSQEAVNTINKINAAMQIGALICEVSIAKNPFTMLMPKTMVDNIKLIGGEMGVMLKTNLLPAPDKDGNVEVPSSAISVTKEVKEEAKKEAAIVEEKPELDPSKIASTDALIKAVIYILADTKSNVRPYDRINAAIDFYYSYLYFQAKDDKEKEVVKQTSRAALFEKLTKIVGKCPFSMNGISKILYNITSTTKSPISAFCMLRNNSLNKETGYPTADDSAIADFVRILIQWVANSKIELDKESILTCEENIKVLSKNKKQNAEAIKKEEGKIEVYKKAIDCYNEVISYVTVPNADLIESFETAYTDKTNDNYKVSRRLAAEILKTYYNGREPKSVDLGWILKNIPIYMGVILNMFRDPLSKLIRYNAADISEIVDATPKQLAEEVGEEPEKK